MIHRFPNPPKELYVVANYIDENGKITYHGVDVYTSKLGERRDPIFEFRQDKNKDTSKIEIVKGILEKIHRTDAKSDEIDKLIKSLKNNQTTIVKHIFLRLLNIKDEDELTKFIKKMDTNEAYEYFKNSLEHELTLTFHRPPYETLRLLHHKLLSMKKNDDWKDFYEFPLKIIDELKNRFNEKEIKGTIEFLRKLHEFLKESYKNDVANIRTYSVQLNNHSIDILTKLVIDVGIDKVLNDIKC